MSSLRRTAALLAVITIVTRVAATPKPEDTSNEIDNAIPQVRRATDCRYSVRRMRNAQRFAYMPGIRFEALYCAVYVNVWSLHRHRTNDGYIKHCTQSPWTLVRKRTIPTERPPLVDEI
jgi:hypothetical protein